MLFNLNHTKCSQTDLIVFIAYIPRSGLYKKKYNMFYKNSKMLFFTAAYRRLTFQKIQKWFYQVNGYRSIYYMLKPQTIGILKNITKCKVDDDILNIPQIIYVCSLTILLQY